MIPKFRGKSTAEEKKGEWVYGNLVFDKDLAIIVSGIDEATCEYIAFEDFCSVDIDTVGQSTGLFDKNGVEIFEGDVVKQVLTQPTTEDDLTGVVIMIECAWLIVNDSKQKANLVWSETNENEVLGNIYENPELMEDNA